MDEDDDDFDSDELSDLDLFSIPGEEECEIDEDALEEWRRGEEQVRRKVREMLRQSLVSQANAERQLWETSASEFISMLIDSLPLLETDEERNETVDMIIDVHFHQDDWEYVRDRMDPDGLMFARVTPEE